MKTETKKKDKQTSYAAWHFVLADLLVRIIDPKDLEIYPFEKLGTLPLESDFIIIRKNEGKDLGKLYPDFAFMMPYLGKYTVVEYKSPLDRLTFNDFDTVRTYMMLSKRKHKIVYDRDIHVISLASKFEKGYPNYIKENGFSYRRIKKGIYGHERKDHHFYWMNLKEIGDKEPENLINIFSSNYKYYWQNLDKLSKMRHFELLVYVCETLSKKEYRMNNIDIRQTRGYDKLIGTIDSMRKEYIASLDVEERLMGLKPEQRLMGLKPEEVLSGFKPEEVLSGFKPEERLAGLNTEERKKLRELLTDD
jgi:hypothetical protein